MKMIHVNDQCWIASDQIAEVTINPSADSVTVRTRAGIGHHVPRDHGQSAYTTADRLIAEINKAEAD